MSKNLRVKVGKAFEIGSSKELVEWLDKCISTVIEEEENHRYKLTSIKITDQKDYTDDGERIVWVNIKFKRTKEKTQYIAKVVEAPPSATVYQDTENWMNGVTCETTYEEIARSTPLLWAGKGIGVVIVKDRYQ